MKKKVLENGTWVTHEYDYDGNLLIREKYGDTVLWFMYDVNGSPIGFRQQIGTSFYSHYYIKNAQGDVIAVANGNGTIVARYTYDSWGKILSITDNNGNDVSNNANHIANINPLRYRGYYYDKETGLYYLQSRYYDPVTGRFVNADGLVAAGETLFSTNMFAYCENDPVNYSDSSGHCRYGLPCTYAIITGIYKRKGDEENCPHRHISAISVVEEKKGEITYSLYDNDRFRNDTPWHETAFSATISGPSANISEGSLGLGSIDTKVMTGGWEWKNVDLNPLDVGNVNLAAEFKEGTLTLGAKASIWTPSVVFKIGGVNIKLYGEVGSIGAKLQLGCNSFELGGAGGVGGGIAIFWDNN